MSLDITIGKAVDGIKEFYTSENRDLFSRIVVTIVRAIDTGGRLFIAGNGGSAADSLHIAGELICKLSRVRRPLPAESLCADIACITSIANDFGYQYIFSRQLEAKANGKDIFLGLTTSGNSANIIEALGECNRLRIPSVIFTGYHGGYAKELANYCLIAPGETANEIQQIHIILYHALCKEIEDTLCPV